MSDNNDDDSSVRGDGSPVGAGGRSQPREFIDTTPSVLIMTRFWLCAIKIVTAFLKTMTEEVISRISAVYNNSLVESVLFLSQNGVVKHFYDVFSKETQYRTDYHNWLNKDGPPRSGNAVPKNQRTYDKLLESVKTDLKNLRLRLKIDHKLYKESIGFFKEFYELIKEGYAKYQRDIATTPVQPANKEQLSVAASLSFESSGTTSGTSSATSRGSFSAGGKNIRLNNGGDSLKKVTSPDTCQGCGNNGNVKRRECCRRKLCPRCFGRGGQG